ncbi:hypothetical protein NESM_000733300 [Novymonas esmeraldas]|uniref:Uncharacterized protein n=1 Tax=Novymonas esmeraldas TaxID=1808958 RepID=A0AAW0EXK3_9TRYP
MKNGGVGGGAANRELTRSLYRRVLKLVSVAEQPHTQRIMQTRWVEFVPSQVWIERGDELRHIARRSFEAPFTPAAVANAFTFLKEARDSLFSIWVLAEWERVEAQEHWDLYDGMVLMSAALYGARAGCDTHQSFESSIKDYQVCIRSYVQGIARAVQQRMEVSALEAGHVEDLTKFVEIVREASALERRDATPEDFSLLSVLQTRCASEYVLNIVLLLVLRALNIHSTLVGANLAFRWVRVMPRNNAPTIFASWSYGAMPRQDVERLIRTADAQWYYSVPWDSLQRKSVVCALLRRQLGCLKEPLDAVGKKVKSTCKEQILFLLS